MQSTVLSIIALAACAAASPVASQVDSTTVVIEASHGGAGNGLHNTTITVPVGQVYVNREALAEVSTLYITVNDGVTCIPYHAETGTGSGALPFSFGKPSYLSTNTVVVGSLVCTSA